MTIRLARAEDVPQIVAVFYNTVHRVNLGEYTQEQVDAWVPVMPDVDDWRKNKLPTRTTIVAEMEGRIAGFGELEDNGHIDCFYCHHEFQRRGVGRAIYAEIERLAIAHGLTRLFADVSITARPFFEAMGFSLLKQQTVVCRGVAMSNFAMEKRFVT